MSREYPARGPARCALTISSPCEGPRSSGLGLLAARPAQALAGKFDAMGVVNETVHDGVGVGWCANHVMPGGQGKLRGDDRRSPAISLFEDFEQVVPGAGVERLEAEVVEDEQIGAAGGVVDERV